jgi:hypothetical protein
MKDPNCTFINENPQEQGDECPDLALTGSWPRRASLPASPGEILQEGLRKKIWVSSGR